MVGDLDSTKPRPKSSGLLTLLLGNNGKNCHLQAMAQKPGYLMYLLRGYVRVFTENTIMLRGSSQGESSVLRVRLRVVKNPLQIHTRPL